MGQGIIGKPFQVHFLFAQWLLGLHPRTLRKSNVFSVLEKRRGFLIVMFLENANTRRRALVVFRGGAKPFAFCHTLLKLDTSLLFAAESSSLLLLLLDTSFYSFVLKEAVSDALFCLLSSVVEPFSKSTNRLTHCSFFPPHPFTSCI